jgi:hypothetical protein
MESAAPKLDLSIRSILRPHLESDGFKGSGKNFRRVSGGWIHAINVQTNKYGGSFAINFGIHPECVPADFQSDPKKIREVDCEFRCRLSEIGSDQWWTYENTQASMDAAVALATDVYLRIGQPFLAQFSGPDCPLAALTPADLGLISNYGFSTSDLRAALVLARLYKAGGNPELARQFAEWGLANLGNATALKQPFEQILNTT